MKVITIANNKGGVAKTTSAQNIAYALAGMNYSVLAVDLDSQASLTRCLGLKPSEIEYTVSDVLLDKKGFEEVALSNGKLAVLPANKQLGDYESALNSSPRAPQNLKKVLKKLDFDFVVIDCPPALSVYTRNALAACDYYFIPLQVEFLSYEGLREFIEYAAEMEDLHNCQLGGVFATRFNPNMRNAHAQAVVKNTSTQLGHDFMETYIRENNAISKAQLNRQSVFTFDPESNGARDYKKLTEEILERMKL